MFERGRDALGWRRGDQPEEGLAAIHARFGAHAGHRALHAKGVICAATFTATPEAAALTRAGHMSGEPVATTARFSNGGGDPTVPDYAPDVRGLAVAFQLARRLAHRHPRPDPPRTSRSPTSRASSTRWRSPSPRSRALLKLPGLRPPLPAGARRAARGQRLLGRRASFAARRYYPFHAFSWIDADGSERFVRYRWLPTVDEPDISKAEAKRRGADYLFDELAERLEREPVRMRLEVQIAGDGDDLDDPSSIWPDDRERVIVGTLEVTAIDPDADDSIVIDPMRLVDGIEPSDDPVLRYRPAVYDLSHARRSADLPTDRVASAG